MAVFNKIGAQYGTFAAMGAYRDGTTTRINMAKLSNYITVATGSTQEHRRNRDNIGDPDKEIKNVIHYRTFYYGVDIASFMNNATAGLGINYEIINDRGGILPSGHMTFVGLNKQQLSNFAIIPEEGEDGTPYIVPSNGTYSGDGFYFKNFTDDKYWYKVSGGSSVTISRVNETKVKFTPYISDSWKTIAKLRKNKIYKVGWEPKSRSHYQINPFDKNEKE